MKCVRIGVDNGADGGIVALDEAQRVLLQEAPPYEDIGVERVRRTTGEKYEGTKRILDVHALVAIIRRLVGLGELADGDIFAVLEYAQPMPKEGSVTSFHYGGGVYAYQAAFAMAGIPFEVVKPARWQGVALRGVEGTDTKAQSILKAQRSIHAIDLAGAGNKARRGGRADAANMAAFALGMRPAGGVQPLPGADGFAVRVSRAKVKGGPVPTPMTAAPPPPPAPRPLGPPPPPPRRA